MPELTESNLVSGAFITSRSGLSVKVTMRQPPLVQGGDDFVVIRYCRSGTERRMPASSALERFGDRPKERRS